MKDLVYKRFISERLQKALKTNKKLFNKLSNFRQGEFKNKDFINNYNDTK